MICVKIDRAEAILDRWENGKKLELSVFYRIDRSISRILLLIYPVAIVSRRPNGYETLF